MNIREILGKSCHARGGGKLSTESQLRLSVSTKEQGRKSLTICIGSDLMKQQRFMIGDRVTLDIDPIKSEATIRRSVADTNELSWKLTPRRGGRKDYRGQMVRAHFSVTMDDKALACFGMRDAIAYIPEIVLTGPQGMTFALKERWNMVNTSRA